MWAASESYILTINTRNSSPRDAPGATTHGDSAIKVSGVEQQEFFLEQQS